MSCLNIQKEKNIYKEHVFSFNLHVHIFHLLIHITILPDIFMLYIKKKSSQRFSNLPKLMNHEVRSWVSKLGSSIS